MHRISTGVSVWQIELFRFFSWSLSHYHLTRYRCVALHALRCPRSAYIVASVFAGLLLVMNIIISFGVIAAWRNKKDGHVLRSCHRCLHRWSFVPIFIFSDYYHLDL